MPELNFSLANLASQIIQDIQTLSQSTSSLENTAQLQAIALPQNTLNQLKTITATVSTEQAQQVQQQQQQFKQRLQTFQSGLQIRQQLIAQTAQRRKDQLSLAVEGKFVVTGRILDQETGAGLPNVKVKAFDYDRQEDDLLGTVVTDADGFYRLEYSAEQFQERGENSPEVYIQALDENEETIFESPKSFNLRAGPVTTLSDTRISAIALPKSRAMALKLQQLRTEKLSVLTDKQIGLTFGRVQL
ncbi:MAG: carboxypeptidase-like regulatory domain-containing protein [Cyanobacteria bacterium J06560_6]